MMITFLLCGNVIFTDSGLYVAAVLNRLSKEVTIKFYCLILACRRCITTKRAQPYDGWRLWRWYYTSVYQVFVVMGCGTYAISAT
jgi:hypothetical protein